VKLVQSTVKQENVVKGILPSLPQTYGAYLDLLTVSLQSTPSPFLTLRFETQGFPEAHNESARREVGAS
jgi:hypothetical protein